MKTLLIGFAACSLVSCGVQSSAPRPAASKYMRSVGAGIMLTKLPQGFGYRSFILVTLLPGAPVPAYAEARFANPGNPAKPFVVKGTPNLKDSKSIDFNSPLFSTLPASGLSQVTVDLCQDRAHRKQVDRLVQDFTTPSPQTLARMSPALPAAQP